MASDRLLDLLTRDEIEVIPAIIPSYVDPELIRVRVKENDENGVTRINNLISVVTRDAAVIASGFLTHLVGCSIASYDSYQVYYL